MFTTVFLLLLPAVSGVFVNRTGCGTSKGCIFKPLGCDPNLDCTTAVVVYVTGPNTLRVEMAATALIPSVQQQYIAVAFSHDNIMGDDAVTECVLSNMGELYGYEPEIFVSFNKGKSNDRVFLNNDEYKALIKNIESEVVDGRIVCAFTQQIIPQIDSKNNLIWPLDKEYYLMGATGSAQPDEVNPHDMNRGSHFYPVISTKKINPSLMTDKEYSLPSNKISAAESHPTSAAPEGSTTTKRPPTASASSALLLIPFLLPLLN